jgi:hypothetical protein
MEQALRPQDILRRSVPEPDHSIRLWPFPGSRISGTLFPRFARFEVSMLRRLSWTLIFPLVLSLQGCSGSGDLPTAPPPPPEGSVKASSSAPASLPPEAIKKLRGNKAAKINSDVQAN